jgi:Ca2+-binding EF-hand superfamily protein
MGIILPQRMVEAAKVDEVPKASISGPMNVNSGGTFALAYTLSNVTDHVYGQDMVVNFDSTVLELRTVTAADYGEGITVEQPIIVADGKVKVKSTNASKDTAKLMNHPLTLNFKVKDSVATDSISIEIADIVVSNGVGLETSVQGLNYTVNIQSLREDLNALKELINVAVAKHAIAEEGKIANQYPVGSKDKLQNAINSAQSVANNDYATMDEIKAAVVVLNTALHTFASSQNVSELYDLNKDGKYSIGDLSLVSAAFGKNGKEPNWDQYKAADVNQDGTVDIMDLSVIAQLILNNSLDK